MTAAHAADTATAQVVGKKQLCALLNWSRPTLDKRIDGDPSFPVQTRGGKGGGWEFDVAAVRAYLAGASGARQPDPEAPPTAEVLAFPPAGKTQTRGEETATARRNAAQAAMIEDKLREKRGQLVSAHQMRAVLEVVLVGLRTDLMNMPDQVARELDLSERVAAVMKRRVEASMRATVAKVRQQLGEMETPAEAQDDV